MTENRFRFRAWNKIKKILHYEAEKGLFDLPFHILCKSDEFIIEQCTGLKDRNGKLIYEGDICTYWVEGDFNREVLVKIGFDKKSCYWYINYEGRDYKSSFYCSNIATLKIIGNIHENPELLEEQK